MIKGWKHLTLQITGLLVAMVLTAIASATIFQVPEQHEIIRSNNGDVAVIVIVDKPFLVTLDGRSVNLRSHEAGEKALYFRNLDRGTHVLTITTEDGSETLTFHVMRVHL